MVQVVFVLCMVALIVIGFFCAAKLTHENPLWVRLVVLMPALAAMATLGVISQGGYVAYWPDIFRAVTDMVIYALVASQLTSGPWLDIRTKE